MSSWMMSAFFLSYNDDEFLAFPGQANSGDAQISTEK